MSQSETPTQEAVMTFTLTEVLVLIMAVAVVALAVSVIRAAGRMGEASTEAARTLRDVQALVPRARATLDATNRLRTP